MPDNPLGTKIDISHWAAVMEAKRPTLDELWAAIRDRDARIGVLLEENRELRDELRVALEEFTALVKVEETSLKVLANIDEITKIAFKKGEP